MRPRPRSILLLNTINPATRMVACKNAVRHSPMTCLHQETKPSIYPLGTLNIYVVFMFHVLTSKGWMILRKSTFCPAMAKQAYRVVKAWRYSNPQHSVNNAIRQLRLLDMQLQSQQVRLNLHYLVDKLTSSSLF